MNTPKVCVRRRAPQPCKVTFVFKSRESNGQKSNLPNPPPLPQAVSSRAMIQTQSRGSNESLFLARAAAACTLLSCSGRPRGRPHPLGSLPLPWAPNCLLQRIRDRNCFLSPPLVPMWAAPLAIRLEGLPGTSPGGCEGADGTLTSQGGLYLRTFKKPASPSPGRRT